MPLRHTVTFQDGQTVTYLDNPPMRPRYAYYRFPQGVMHVGSRVREMPPAELDALFEEAGVTRAERKVMAAVSLLEGGFESVNTYDTGYVSVGFIQFACLKDGAGSLGQTLLELKASNPAAFESDFRRFGLDVAPDGALVALDPLTGAELQGAEAARKIIDDKRLIAVFQRAGERSRAFRVAQIVVAKRLYYPAGDDITLQVGARQLSGRISDFVASEAAMAVLMDRKVNTGRIDGLIEAATYCAELCDARSLQDLRKYERDIAFLLKYRRDYLTDASLSQPGPGLLAKRDFDEIASRRGRRGSRTPPPKP